jgi:hypothetical protein
MAVPPSSAGTSTDSHDPAGFRIAHSLLHQLIIVSTGSVLRRGVRDFLGLFISANCNSSFAQVLQRPLDAKPTKWLTFRPSLTWPFPCSECEVDINAEARVTGPWVGSGLLRENGVLGNVGRSLWARGSGGEAAIEHVGGQGTGLRAGPVVASVVDRGGDPVATQ